METREDIWAQLAAKLPWKKTPEDRALRDRQWAQLDLNGNGLLSLAELDKGMQDVIQLPRLFDCKPVLMRAFQAAKLVSDAQNSHSDDYVERSEYRHLLKYLRIYYEYFVAFERVDLDGDRRISFTEFKMATSKLQKWQIDMTDPEQQWRECDVDGKGMVLFDEFCNWAIRKNLDLDDDDDEDNELSGPEPSDAQRARPKPPPARFPEPDPKFAQFMKERNEKMWQELAEKLPWHKTPEDKAKRSELWRQIDINENGLVSLAELDKAMQDVLKLPTLFDCKPVMMRAFNAAKDKVKSKSKHGKDYLERKEFRYLLKYLRIYYEYWVAFERIDTDGDRRVSYEEFLRAKILLERWNVDMSRPEEQWKECDSDGHGMVLFDEFCNWSIRKGLDLDDDDDADDATDSQGEIQPSGEDKSKQYLKDYAEKQKPQQTTAQKTDPRLWAELRQKLPWKKTPEHKALRKQQWRQIDFNGNGLLSLAEFDKGVIDVLKLPLIAEKKAVLIRAFNAAKGKQAAKTMHSDDYVEETEYRHLLKYLRIYFELWIAFERIDIDGDQRLTYKEFCLAKNLLSKWRINMADPKQQWTECDRNNGGVVLFDEFAAWAIKKNLDLDDDDDDDSDTESDGPQEAKLLTQAQRKKQQQALYDKHVIAELNKRKQTQTSEVWAELKAKLPWKKTEADKERRKKLWRQLDVNGNGLVSLAEADKGMLETLKLPVLFEAKPVLLRAFNAAKDRVKSKSKHGDDYLEFKEFRYFLKYLRQYYEYWVAFERVDTDGDRRLTFEEFKMAGRRLQRWGIDMTDPQAQWKECDADGQGKVLFDEFSAWAIRKNLDLSDDDDDDNDTDEEKQVRGMFKPASKKPQSASKPKTQQAKKTDPKIWQELATKLPWRKTEVDKKLRNKQWRAIDINGNGLLSLAEVQKGVRDVLKIPKLFEQKAVILRAFEAAKAKDNGSKKHDGDYVSRKEYRHLLKYLRMYFEYWVAFDQIDADGDKRISEKEFKLALPTLKNWRINVDNPKALFQEMDQDKQGMVLFDEFCQWALKKHLDLPDDDDDQTDDLPVTTLKRQDSTQQRLKQYKLAQKQKAIPKPQKQQISPEVWETLRKKLPFSHTPEDRRQRRIIWQGMDFNGNGLLSLAEVDKGLRDLKLPVLFKIKPVILRAFVAAKSKSPGGNDDYVEYKEFRHLLKYLRMYFEYWIAFAQIDTDKDRRISFNEFQQAEEIMKKWGINTANLQESWAEVDQDKGGQVLFDEFCNWAIRKGLDLEDDDHDGNLTDSEQKIRVEVVKGPKIKRLRKKSAQPKVDSKAEEQSKIWAELREKLPWKKTEKQRHLRAIQFRKIDFNGNGFISLAELDKGLRDTIKLPALFDTKKVIIRAFNAAKDKVPSKSKKGADYIEKAEYRYLLKYLRQYYEFWIAFSRLDTNQDKTISKEEFKHGAATLAGWGVDMSDPDQRWKECDADGGGKVLFDEFCQWAIKHSLDLEDDDDDDEDTEEECESTLADRRGYLINKAKLGAQSIKTPIERPKSDPRLWEQLRKKLPWKRTQHDKELRVKQWKAMDCNGNGLLSLAEVDKGMRDVIKLPVLFDAKPVMMRAFQAAKNKVKSESKHGADFIEKSEYRIFLKYLRQYFEYWVAFSRLDVDHDQRVSQFEFTRAKGDLERWGIDMRDPEAMFKECDKDGKGMILFVEFVEWAIKKNLDLEDDDDDDNSEEEYKEPPKSTSPVRSVHSKQNSGQNMMFGTRQQKIQQLNELEESLRSSVVLTNPGKELVIENQPNLDAPLSELYAFYSKKYADRRAPLMSQQDQAPQMSLKGFSIFAHDMGLKVEKSQVQSVFKKYAQQSLSFVDFKQTLPQLAHLQTQASMQSCVTKLFQHLDAYCHLMRKERLPAQYEHLEELLPAELLSQAQKLMNQICFYEQFTVTHSSKHFFIDSVKIEHPAVYRKLIPEYTKNLQAVTLVDAKKVLKSVSVKQSRCAQLLNQRRSADGRLGLVAPVSGAELWRQTCNRQVQERQRPTGQKNNDLMALSMSSARNSTHRAGLKFVTQRSQDGMSDIDEKAGVKLVKVTEKRSLQPSAKKGVVLSDKIRTSLGKAQRNVKSAKILTFPTYKK